MLIPIMGFPAFFDSRTMRFMSYWGYQLAPAAKPPPWMKTSTGSGVEEVASSGTEMFSVRQSVPDTPGNSGFDKAFWIA